MFKKVGEFIAKEVQGAETIVKAIGAWIKKEEPKIEVLIQAALTDYAKLLPQSRISLQL
jgi:hypothetical protein